MNPVPLFLIIVTLPLLLGGCGVLALFRTAGVVKMRRYEEHPRDTCRSCYPHLSSSR